MANLNDINPQGFGITLRPKSPPQACPVNIHTDAQSSFYKKAADQIDKFNKEMMDLYLDHQKKAHANLIKFVNGVLFKLLCTGNLQVCSP